MHGKWVCFVMVDLIILIDSTPGRFYHDYHGGRDKPSWGQDWHGWRHDWHSGYTQRAKTKGTVKTTAVPIRVESRSSTTPPQPTISDVEIRQGEVSTTTGATSFQSTQAKLTDQQELNEFAPGPEDVASSVFSATVKTTSNTSSSLSIQANFTDQQTLQAFASGPEDAESSVFAATIKTTSDASSSQSTLAKLSDQQTLQAFAAGPEDAESSVLATTIKTTSDALGSQSLQADLTDQHKLLAFAPGPEDPESSVLAATIKTTSDASSSQSTQTKLTDQQELKAFAPGPEDVASSVLAPTVKTTSDASSSQSTQTKLTDQQELKAFAPGPENVASSVLAATVKTTSDASNSLSIQANLTDQQKLLAFAPGPEDTEISVPAATVKTIPDASSSQFVQADTTTDRQTLRAFAPGPEDTENSVPAATTVKTESANVLEVKPDEKTSLWHVAVYRKGVKGEMGSRYVHVCGGSLVKEDIVVSAGHCFWSLIGVQLAPTLFRVAAGKIYSEYDDPRDTGAQYSDTSTIRCDTSNELKPDEYILCTLAVAMATVCLHHQISSVVNKITITEMEEPCYQPDLAVVNLATAFKYTDAVKPLCVNFYWELQQQQLKEGNYGTVASWSVLEDGECKPSKSLNWLSLPFVEGNVCEVKVTSKTTGRDRICAGEMNNATHCDTDSGNALVFYQDKTPYLRGVTTKLFEDLQCTKFYTRSFSNIIGAANHLERLFNQITDNINLVQCENFYKTTNNETTEGPTSNIETVIEFDYGDGGDTPDGQDFGIQAIGSSPVPVLAGTSAPMYQWHVGIYSKAWVPFMQICGGTLVKRDFVISAAHCFWDDTAGQQPPSQFAVAGGKLFRPWNYTQDTYSQHSDVSKIILPVRFRGSATSFQDDIAILRLSSPFTYTLGVQPACLSFSTTFERKQLQPLNLGTVLGWGLTQENGGPSRRLNYIDLPYVDVEDCFANSEPAFLKFITSDKICAGDTSTGHALCRGDSGGGFVVYSGAAPYLHGVASTAAGNANFCNAFALAAFTSTYSHRAFIRENIPDIDKECANNNTEPSTESNIGLGIGNAGSTENVGSIGNVGPTGNAETGNGGLTGHSGLTGNVGSTGTVRPTGNQGLNMIRGNLGNAITATPVFSQLPYYPNHFVCNCNCKT